MLGTFGTVNGKNQKLTLTTSGGTQATFSLSGGSGTVFRDGEGLHLDVSGGGARHRRQGGTGVVMLTDVNVTGSLRSMNARSSDLFGTLSTTGTIGKIALRNVDGIIASAAGSIASVTAASLGNAAILSGANLGTDHVIGGTGTDADTFAAGSIGTIQIAGPVSSSIIGAGIDISNAQNTVIGGKSSSVRSIFVRGGVDGNTRFVGGAFGSARIPQKVNPATDCGTS